MTNILDVATFLLAGYSAFIYTLMLGSVIATGKALVWKGLVTTPIFFLPFLVLVDLIVRSAS